MSLAVFINPRCGITSGTFLSLLDSASVPSLAAPKRTFPCFTIRFGNARFQILTHLPGTHVSVYRPIVSLHEELQDSSTTILHFEFNEGNASPAEFSQSFG